MAKAAASKTKQPTTALAPRKPTAMAAKNINELLLKDEGAGMEGITPQDLQIPRLNILQSGSPQVKKSDGAYIKGAEEGDFYDNVANAVYAKGDQGFLFIPVARRRTNIEWVPKDSGGGFIADHGSDDSILLQCTKDDKGRMMLKNGHEIVTTQEYYVIALDKQGKNPRQAVISMSKTQLKKARKLNTVISSLMVERPDGAGMFNPAMFYSVFRATTVPESNDKGNWMGWNIVRESSTLDLPNGEMLYMQARQFRDAVKVGAVRATPPVDAEPAAAAGEEEEL